MGDFEKNPSKWWRAFKEMRNPEEDEKDLISRIADPLVPQLHYSKDYDRILYSTAFRRLGGVAQVVTAGEVALFHNRLTHTLKTAQVGTRIANFLMRKYGGNEIALKEIDAYGGIDSRVVRAACMAHDLGHPPFGHIAEMELQRIVSGTPDSIERRKSRGSEYASNPPTRRVAIPSGYTLSDSFEGNAQSFRIITKLAFREHVTGRPRSALNLTKGSLAATMKYPWAYDNRPNDAPQKRKWSYYNADSKVAEWALGTTHSKPTPREYELERMPGKCYEFATIEAQIMDWADDISYAIHDAEDFYRAGLIPLHVLKEGGEEWKRFFEYAFEYCVEKKKLVKDDEQDVADLFTNGILRLFPAGPYEGFGSDREALHGFASTTISDAIRGTSINTKAGVVVRSWQQRAVIEILKRLTWYYVIDRPSLQSAQFGQRQMIRSLYIALIEWVEESWHGPGSAILTEDERHSDANIRRPELPARLLSYLDVAFAESKGVDTYGENARISRAVVDYIVSLTEAQTIELHARLTGGSARSMLESWMQL